MIKQEKKQEKKIVKTHEEKNKLNPALNHAAIIRKQKKKLFDLPHIRTILNIRIE